jgi:hypothetical protein
MSNLVVSDSNLVVYGKLWFRSGSQGVQVWLELFCDLRLKFVDAFLWLFSFDSFYLMFYFAFMVAECVEDTIYFHLEVLDEEW